MKKILILIVLILLLSGCSATYEINLNGDKIDEKLTLIETDKSIFDKETDTGWTIRDSFNSLLDSDEFGEENYTVKSLTTEDRLGIEYRSKSATSILNSSIINQCYTNPTVNTVDNKVTINTGSNFGCYEYYDNLESIKITFKTNHKVISTNADTIDGDKYIWNITKDSNKQIEITYDDSITKTNYVPYIIALIAILIVGVIVYFVVKKVKKNNEI